MNKLLVILLLSGIYTFPLFAQEEFMQNTKKQEQRERLIEKLRNCFLASQGKKIIMNDSLYFYTEVIDIVSKNVIAGGTKLPFDEIYRRVEKGVYKAVAEIQRERKIVLRERKNLQEQIKALDKIEPTSLKIMNLSDILKKYKSRSDVINTDQILSCLKINAGGVDIREDVVQIEKWIAFYRNNRYKVSEEKEKNVRKIRSKDEEIEALKKELRKLGE